VEAEVELAVAGAGEPVADNVAGRDVDRGGAGVGGERGGGAITYRPLHKLVWGLAAPEGLVLQNDSWVAGVGEHSRRYSHISRSGGLR
jgi:hypothetical protein